MSAPSASLVFRTAVVSLIVQVVVAGVAGAGFLLKIPAGQKDIVVVLILEFASQVIEFLWYLAVVLCVRDILTWTRYIDWVVSTPLMLLSTFMFFYLRRGLPVADVFVSGDLWPSLALNHLMLVCGFGLEAAVLPRLPSLVVGTGSLVGSFTFLARALDGTDSVSVTLFWVMFVVWFGYGFAAVLPYEPKNVGYNALDVVSKNGYSVFLFVYILQYDAWFARDNAAG